jgi:hypothetical protein
MSVVSSRIDNVTLKGNRRRNFIAVQRSVPGSDIAYKLGPAMVDPSATARRLAKKCEYEPPAPKGVPLLFLQSGFEDRYASTPFYETQKLKAPNPMPGYINYESLMSELFIPFDTPIDYAMGIRPGRRALKVQTLPQPEPVPLFRTGI